MITFKQFFLESAQYSFKYLPSKPPYGFVIMPDGGYVPVFRVGDHAASIMTDEDGMEDLFMIGGIRMAVAPIDDKYVGEGVLSRMTSKAKKTAKDIAMHYRYEIEFEPFQHYG
jgi:hypothetical protein